MTCSPLLPENRGIIPIGLPPQGLFSYGCQTISQGGRTHKLVLKIIVVVGIHDQSPVVKKTTLNREKF